MYCSFPTRGPLKGVMLAFLLALVSGLMLGHPMSPATVVASPQSSVVNQATSCGAVGYPAGYNLAGGPTGTVLSGAAGTLFTLPAGATAYQSVTVSTALSGGIGVWAFFRTASTVTLPCGTGTSLAIGLPVNQVGMAGNPFDGNATISGSSVPSWAITFNTASNAFGSWTRIDGANSLQLGVGQGAFVFAAAGGTLTLIPVGFSKTINPPSTKSFDIGFIDNTSGKYVLADRTNSAVDLVDAKTDTFLGFVGQGGFAGLPAASACSGPSASFCEGPNGVVIDGSGNVWAGDGDSTIKVAPATASGAVIKSLPTGGKFRADELSFDPKDNLILIANDKEGFLTFVNTSTQSVAGHFYYSDNTVGAAATLSGHSTNASGMEQSVYNPQTGLFYQAIPAGTNTAGFIDVFDPVSEKLLNTFPVAGCSGGPTGLALSPTNQKFLGACTNGGALIEAANGKVDQIVPNVGGADEVWFNPGDGNWYLGIRGVGVGVVNSINSQVGAVVANPSGAGSVAAYSGNNTILNPISTGGGITVFVSTPH